VRIVRLVVGVDRNTVRRTAEYGEVLESLVVLGIPIGQD
jgi:hypothetical protein